MKKLTIALATAAATVFVATAAHAGITGNYKRPNGSIAKVWMCGGGLCGKVVKGKGSGTVMFNGIKKAGKVWKGDMKHPDMPSFMTFNGTITPMGGGKIKVQGCAIGQSMCDAETWVKVR